MSYCGKISLFKTFFSWHLRVSQYSTREKRILTKKYCPGKKDIWEKKSNAILKVFSQTKVINISWRWRDAYHLRCRRFQTDFQRQIPWKLRILFYDNEIIPTISSTYSRIYKTPPTFEKNPSSTFEWIIYWFWNWRTSAPKKRPSFIYRPGKIWRNICVPFDLKAFIQPKQECVWSRWPFILAGEALTSSQGRGKEGAFFKRCRKALL